LDAVTAIAGLADRVRGYNSGYERLIWNSYPNTIGGRLRVLPAEGKARCIYPATGLYSARGMFDAELKALIDEYEAAARRGEIAMIKNLSA
jgi:hypothetical protein